MTVEDDLPGGTTIGELQEVLRASLERPGIVVDSVECTPIAHHITAPTTASLTRVRVGASDDGPIEVELIAKVLQSARHGLPGEIPEAVRERIAAGIPWRLEWEIYTGDTAERMPPGLRLPRLYGVVEHSEDRLTLWLEDVDAIDTAWTAENLSCAALALGRMSARRADQVLHTSSATSFLGHFMDNGVRRGPSQPCARTPVCAPGVPTTRGGVASGRPDGPRRGGGAEVRRTTGPVVDPDPK